LKKQEFQTFLAAKLGGVATSTIVQNDITKEYSSRIRAAVEQDKWF
jgi:hypothetical protein